MQNYPKEVGLIPRDQFPPGVRFHPTDEELIFYYLRNKVNRVPLETGIIGEIELYNFNPWELPDKAIYGDGEWYFFSPRDRKYPNGARPRRTTGSGYWKATGRDKQILNSYGLGVGVKKSLVFYCGKAPDGLKTDWIMTEYRLLPINNTSQPSRPEKSMRLDDWVLCRIRTKGNKSNNAQEVHQMTSSNQVDYVTDKMEFPSLSTVTSSNQVDYLPHMMEFPSPSTGTNTDYTLPKSSNLLNVPFADQELPPNVNISASNPQNGVSNCGSGKEILETNYSLQDFLNQFQGKRFEENALSENHQQTSKVMQIEINNRDFISYNLQTSVASFYDQYQLQGDLANFHSSPSQ